MPWELGKSVVGLNAPFPNVGGLGRCSLPAEHRQIDVRRVIWLGTSNIGHDLVFKCYGPSPGKTVTREEYLELAQLLRPGISHSLGVRNTTDTLFALSITLDFRLRSAHVLRRYCHSSLLPRPS